MNHKEIRNKINGTELVAFIVFVIAMYNLYQGNVTVAVLLLIYNQTLSISTSSRLLFNTSRRGEIYTQVEKAAGKR